MSARNKWICAVLGCVAMQGEAVPITPDTAVEHAKNWMAGNPVMSKAGQTVASVETFPDSGAYSVYVVQLSPKGFLILNSDDRLPLLVSFSSESVVDLSDDPQNTLRAMLLSYCERKEDELANWVPVLPGKSAMAVPVVSEDELYGPFLETSWNQTDPYNLLCPAAASGSGYDGRAPVGCVPTTFAQLMKYHRWPYYGSGSLSYTDSSGSVTGLHSADFSDAYDWNGMLSAHSSADQQENQDAVAELMYELGVAAGVNYEGGGTSGNSTTLGSSLGEYCYYDSIEPHDSQAELIAPMEAELRAGFPCIVSYPGHDFIADGLMVDGGLTTYHFNMGWGGYNNGWYTKDAAPTGGGAVALSGGITSFRPQLMAFPQTNAVSGEGGSSAEVRWILPKRLEGEVSKLTINQLKRQAGGWQSDASQITGLNSGWDVVSGGRSGDCWYGGDYGTFSMVLKEVFVPDASAQLTFWMKYYLYNDLFSVSVSTDEGVTYSNVLSEEKFGSRSWAQKSVSLTAYAGQEIRIKISLKVSGTYYPTGGVWLDDLAVTSGDWYDWQLFAEDTTLASRRFSAVTTVWDDCDDFSVFEVTSTAPWAYSGDWSVVNESGVGNCFHKKGPEYSYTYHVTSRSSITPSSSTRLKLYAKYRLASEAFRILVSTDRSGFTEIWSTSGAQMDWGDLVLDLSAYAGQEIFVRLEYEFLGTYYSGGGIWIDSISMQEVTNPELEGQPIHYTALSNLPAGTHTLAAVLTDTSGVEHAPGPSFSMAVSGVADDGDGMPADWEAMYGLNPSMDDGDLDPDNDGFSNWEEYLSGTVPTNAASVWRLTKGSGSLPAFQGMGNRFYTIQYCDGLASNVWETLSSGIVGSNGLFEVNSYESITNECRFYRVWVQEAE